LRKELTDGCGKYYDNPILLIHPDCNVDKKFHEIVTESYVYKAEILTQDDCSLDFLLDALEPLDIVKIKRKTKDFKIEFYHSGIYLGNKQFFHMHDLVEKNLMKARIDDVSVFLGNTETS
jgi:hypothetical protein